MDTTGKTSPRRVVQAGQGLVEYALILSCVAALAIGAAFFLGGRINGVLSTVGSSVDAALSAAHNQGGGNQGGGNQGGGNQGGGNQGGGNQGGGNQGGGH
jgi:Flp pilus assembly pilin Flp